MHRITRRFQFCAGHRVYQHESKCRHLHGHNYVALVSCSAHMLDAIGRVLDFSEVKARIGEWIDANWDHAFIAFKQDIETLDHLARHGHKHYVMESNPTAENMARVLLDQAQALMPEGISVDRVVLWETENCYAEVER